MSYPLLTDFWPHGEVSAKFGILDVDGADFRSTFAVDKSGIIRFVQVVPGSQARMYEDMRRALESVIGGEAQTLAA